MNKTLLTIIITALIVGGGVYMWQQNEMLKEANQELAKKVTETAETTPVAEEPTEPSMKEMIEDFDSYVAVGDAQKQQMIFPPGGCVGYKYYLDGVASGEMQEDAGYEERMKDVDWEYYIELGEKLKAGEVKKKVIFSGVGTGLSLILTPRYDFEEKDRDEMNKCIEGLGYLSLFKVFDDKILWGGLQCGGGVGYTEEQKPGFAASLKECKEIREKLIEYQES